MLTDQEFTAAYKQFYLRGIKMVKRRFGLSWDDSEDVVQEGWARAWRFRAQFAGDSSLFTWVTVIISNVWRDRLRKARVRRLDFFAEYPCEPIYDPTKSIETAIDCRLIIGRMHRNRAEVIRLHRINGLDLKETGQITGHTVLSVKMLDHYAMVGARADVMRSVHELR